MRQWEPTEADRAAAMRIMYEMGPTSPYGTCVAAPRSRNEIESLIAECLAKTRHEAFEAGKNFGIK